MKIRMFTLPNMITLANLALGCMAIVFSISGAVADSDTNGNLVAAFWFIMVAAIADFADGGVARLSRQHSEIGTQLDSLADMVSFGVAPSMVLLAIYRGSPVWEAIPAISNRLGGLVLMVALCSALRLARFNVDKTQKDEFTGLPTPAAALAIAALGAMWQDGMFPATREMVILSAAVVSYLLMCPVRMFSLKFTGLGWRGNEIRYIFLLTSAAVVFAMGMGGVPLAVALYVAISTVRYFVSRRKA